jgi:hypothetical protein
MNLPIIGSTWNNKNAETKIVAGYAAIVTARPAAITGRELEARAPIGRYLARLSTVASIIGKIRYRYQSHSTIVLRSSRTLVRPQGCFRAKSTQRSTPDGARPMPRRFLSGVKHSAANEVVHGR